MTSMQKPHASVVIPAFNEEQALPLCLNALASQKTTRLFEVIVVDNNSTDRTMEVARSFSGRLQIRAMNEPMQGRGAARRSGCAAAGGDILFSTDADTQVPENWIEMLCDALEKDTSIVAVATPPRIDDCGAVRNAVYNGLSFWTVRFSHTLYGFSFALRKSTYNQAGGFEVDSDADEDVELGYKVRKFGKIRFLNLPVHMSGRRFKDGMARGILLYASAYVRKFVFGKKHVPLDNPR